jgi:hypothetical protein
MAGNRVRNPNGFLFRERTEQDDAPRFGWRFDSQRLNAEGEWVKIGAFQNDHDDRRLDRHAASFGGDVRLVRKKDGAVVAQWRDGARVETQKGAAE